MRTMLALASLTLALPALAAEPAVRSFRLPPGGALELHVPADWKLEVHGGGKNLPPTIAFSPPEGRAFSLQITPLWNTKDFGVGFEPAEARAHAERARDEVQRGAVEPEVQIEELHGPLNRIHWYRATDRAPKPGEWARLVQGTALVDGKLLLFFTLLHDGPDVPERVLTLKAIGGARLVEGGEAPARPSQGREEPPPQGLYALAPSIALELVLPASWGAGSRPNDDGRPDSLLFAPERGKGFTLLVSPVPAPPAALGAQGSRAMSEKLRTALGEGTVGPIQEFRGERRSVHWFVSATKKPEARVFRWLTAGAAAVGDLLVTFNLLHQAEEPPDRALVLQALGRARQVDLRRARVAETVALAFAGKPWALLVDLPGLAIEKGGGKPDGSVMLQGRSEEAGLVASIFLLAAPGPGGAAECRAAYFEAALASPFEKADVTRSERGVMAIGEYLIPRAEGKEVRQKHLNAYLARDGVWIDVHLSRVGFQPAEQVLFERVLSSIRFSDQ